MAKIPIFLEPANPLPDDLDAWAEQVAEAINAEVEAMEGEEMIISSAGDESGAEEE